jgi:hypothetical protein
VLDGTCGFVRLTATGDIEVELYDHSKQVRIAFDGDVSTIYTVRKGDLPRLVAKLTPGGGDPTPSNTALAEQLGRFIDIDSLIDWLTMESGVPVLKRVDFEV